LDANRIRWGKAAKLKILFAVPVTIVDMLYGFVCFRVDDALGSVGQIADDSFR
jgi:hypothetical protein